MRTTSMSEDDVLELRKKCTEGNRCAKGFVLSDAYPTSASSVCWTQPDVVCFGKADFKGKMGTKPVCVGKLVFNPTS